MSDASGTLAYSYDELSRLESETKDFVDTLTNEPSGGYKLEYTYHLSGGIKSIEDPFGAMVTYTADKTGRMTAIGDASSSTAFASGVAYRAFGGVKSMSYATTAATNISLTYDTRLRPATYEAESSANTVDIQNKTYTYTNDGSIKQAADNVEAKFGQLYEYDFAARLKKNQFGTGSTSPTPQYKQLLGYDAFSNLTNRQTWDKDNTERTFSAAYTNNRKTTGGYGIGTDTHDSAGNVVRNIVAYTPVDERNWKFDAAGRMTDWEETSTYVGTTRWDQGAALTFDGDGRTAKRVERRRVWASPPTGWYEEAEYSIISSVTGQTIIELDYTGAKKKASVYMGSSAIAEQVGASSPFEFKNIDPVTGSSMTTDDEGDFPPNDSGRTEFEPLGAALPIQEPDTSEPPKYNKGGMTHNPESGCQFNGASVSCSRFRLIIGMLGSRNYTVIDTRRGVGSSSMTLTHFVYEGPDPPSKPDDPSTPDDDSVVGVGSIAEWWEVHVIVSEDKDGLTLISEVVARARERARRQRECDNALRNLFAGPNSIVATIFEPKELVEMSNGEEVSHVVAGIDRSKTEFASNLHVYGDPKGKKSGPLVPGSRPDQGYCCHRRTLCSTDDRSS
jgi:hypothetical protein